MHKQQAHCLKENIGCRQAAKETVVMRDFKNHFLVIDNQTIWEADGCLQSLDWTGGLTLKIIFMVSNNKIHWPVGLHDA